MKLKRKLIYLGLICSLTLSTNIYNTFANNNKINATITETSKDNLESIEDIEDNNTPLTRKSILSVNESLTSSTGSQTVTFETTKSMRYYRIYVRNDSNVNYILVAPTGATYTVRANNSNTIYTLTAASIDKKTVSLTSKDGSKLNGHISIRIAETPTEVMP